ncbi:MAG: methyltransferase domain-containing protein [Defluviitaleaceae bacterium]|nr:methyltransferase domain-containing protein [Defluviitaleaceae bacterium]
MTKFIFTSQDDSWDLALAEARESLKPAGFSLVRWLCRGVGLGSAEGGFSDISKAVRDSSPIFIRHIFPVDYELDFFAAASGASLGENSNISPLLTGAAEKLGRMPSPEKPFSVQVWEVGSSNDFFPMKGSLARQICDYLETRGFTQDAKNPVNVISILIDNNHIYAGVSAAYDNLSAWPGGMRRFGRGEERISRAEFKLLEAAEVFSMDLSSFNNALDLGAAPGGWSRVLAEAGAEVCAVDPAELSEKVSAYPGIRHYKTTAQEFARKNTRAFDLIVNDMRMDARESAEIMLGAAEMLTEGGAIVMTLKLPEAKKRAAMDRALAVLEKGYEGLRAKQLFHNRSEVTVAGRKRR